MRKLLSLILALVMCFSLAGCGNSDSNDDSSTVENSGDESKIDSEYGSDDEEPEPGTKEYVEQIFSGADNFEMLQDNVQMENGFLGAAYQFYDNDESPLEMTVIYEKSGDVALAIITCDWEYIPMIYAQNLAIALGVDYDLQGWYDQYDSSGYVYAYDDGWFVTVAQDTTTLKWTIGFDNKKWQPEEDSNESTPTSTQESESSAESEPSSEATADYITDGMYKVGTDIEPGKYYIMAENSNSAYWCINEDSAGDSIIANNIVPTFGYFEVQDGEYLEVSNGYVIPADEAPIPTPDSNGAYGEGHYLVGRDIPAGEYNAVAETGDSGYYCISYDANTDDIYANDIFDANAYVTVSDGQYLTVSSATITPVE